MIHLNNQIIEGQTDIIKKVLGNKFFTGEIMNVTGSFESFDYSRDPFPHTYFGFISVDGDWHNFLYYGYGNDLTNGRTHFLDTIRVYYMFNVLGEEILLSYEVLVEG